MKLQENKLKNWDSYSYDVLVGAGDAASAGVVATSFSAGAPLVSCCTTGSKKEENI